ncbi:MAG: toll/interleukin-1 receptor domain-containing protein [bacterium]
MSESDYFISYSRKDYHAAKVLSDALVNCGLQTWYDQEMQPGEEWRDSIYSAIKQTKAMLLLMSSNALQSKEMKKEVAVARQEDIPIVVIRLEDIKLSGAFAYELSGVNWIDWFHDGDVGRVIGSLTNKKRPVSLSKQSYSKKKPKSKPKLSIGKVLVAFFFISIFQTILYWSIISDDAYNAGFLGGFENFNWLVVLLTTVGSPIVFLGSISKIDSIIGFSLIVTSLINTILLFVVLKWVISKGRGVIIRK